MDIPRRNFVKNIGLVTAGTAVGLVDCCGKSRPDTACRFEAKRKSNVVVCVRPQLFPAEKNTGKEACKELLTDALCGFFNSADYKKPLNSLFSAADKIAVKVNCLSGMRMSTHPELVWAMVDILIEIGISSDNIIIWDRYDRDLTGAGYILNKGKGVKVIGNDSYGFTRELFSHASIGSFFSGILRDADKIINMPVLKDHGIVGVTLGMKNFFGAIHNPNKYHLNAGDPYVADLFSHPWIKNKVKLTIIDGIVGQYEGGPPSMPPWQWNFGGIIVGQDPVSVDRTGLDIIEQKRAENNIMSLTQASRFPEYLKTAEKLGLGNFSKDKIEIAQV